MGEIGEPGPVRRYCELPVHLVERAVTRLIAEGGTNRLVANDRGLEGVIGLSMGRQAPELTLFPQKISGPGGHGGPGRGCARCGRDKNDASSQQAQLQRLHGEADFEQEG